jgi:PAS domain S-box-containing protein
VKTTRPDGNGHREATAPDFEGLEHFFDLSLDLLAVADSHGYLKRVNRAWPRRLGYAERELLSTPYVGLVHPEDRDRTLAELERLVGETKGAITFENRLRCKDGSYLWLLWSVKSDPRQELIYLAAKDVTERRALERGQWLLFERNPRPMWVYDLDTLAFLAVNDAAVRHYGYSRDEFLSMTIEDIRPSDDLPALAEHLAEGRPGYELPDRWRHRKKDGTVVEVDVSSHDVPFPGRRARLVLATDVTERVRVEAKLRAAEALESAILDSTLDAVITIDGGGRVIEFNPAAEKTFGYSRAAAVGSELAELIIPSEQREAHRRGLARLAATGVGAILNRRLELPAMRADGSRLPVELTVTPLEVEDRPPLYAGFVRDLTEREAARAEIARLARNRDLILASVEEGIYGLDREGCVTFVNPAAARMLGFEIAELIGEDAHELLHHARPDGSRHPRGACPICSALGDGAVHRVTDQVFRRKDGSSFPVECTSAPIRDAAEVLGAVCAFRDITERRRADEALTSSAERIRDLYDNAPCGYHSLDKDMVFVQINETELGWLGYEHDEVVGRLRFPDLMTPSSARSFERQFARLEREGFLRDLQLELVRRDGTTFPVLVSATVVSDPAGAFVMSRATVFDVTELTGALREKERLEAQLHQARRLDSLGQLAGGIAHDFNNLLSVILNYAAFVIDDLDDPRQRQDVEEIHRAAERAADLTRQLLVFSRHEAVTTQAIDLSRAITATERLLRRTIGENIELRTSLAAELPPAELGAGQLEQVLINLAVNARDAMPGGGTLTIELGEVEVADADIPSFLDLTPGPYAQLTVSDTGCGMSPEVAAQAFDPFFTTKARGHGTGLGLATVYGIARQAGGGIHLYSEPGRGTAVKVYLPAGERSPAPAPAETSPADRRGRRETVLLVEDEESVRSVARRILSEHAYEVVAADGPAEALARCAERSFDLLVTDVVMPGMSGSELAQRIRTLRPDLPVLFISGYTGDVVLRQGAVGRDARLLEKPFTARTLLGAVREALEADRPQSDVEGGSDG